MVGRPNTSRPDGGFTLIELLAVVSIIALLGITTIASYQSIARDVRRANAVEQVKAMLGLGRERAMLDGRTTMVGFRSVIDREDPRVEVFIAQATGDTTEWRDGDFGAIRRITRFVPLDDIERSFMPRGTSVAIPAHRYTPTSNIGQSVLPYVGDFEYLVPSNLATNTPEAAGVVPGILFGRDGAPVSFIMEHDAIDAWVDFDGNGLQRIAGWDYANRGAAGEDDFADATECWLLPRRTANGQWIESTCLINESLPLCQRYEDDEPFVAVGPYLAVFDDRTAREELDPTRWNESQGGAARRGHDLSDFIAANGRQLYFNRFSGVALEASER